MFHPSPKASPTPSYRNPDAEEGGRRRVSGSIEAWSFGREIDLYNSRNIYTKGGDWKRPQGGIPWVEDPSDEYVEFSSDLVPSTGNPRLQWGGWRRGWGSDADSVRPEQLFIHRGDFFPRPQSRSGKDVYRTRKNREAWGLWEKCGGRGVRWWGSGCLEVEYASDLSDLDRASIGWKRTREGALLDIDTPLPEWIRASGFILPGHDPLKWVGVSQVTAKISGREGCFPGSFIVDNPKEAGRLLRGCQMVPCGCEIKVDDRYSLGRHSGGHGLWIEGKAAVPSRRMVPLKKGVSHVTLHVSRAGRAVYLVDPDDIDFSQLRRPVIGTYYAKGRDEKCLITPETVHLKSSAAVSRMKVVEDFSIFYRVVAPMDNEKKISTQRMVGAARAARLPARNKGEQERMLKAYGDVVGEDYHRRSDEYYREAARARDEALSEGFLDHSSAKERSVVPGEVFDKLSSRGAVASRKIPTGREYFRPFTFEDISGNPRLIGEIARIAGEDGLGWLCQLVAMHPREFIKALVAGAINAR